MRRSNLAWLSASLFFGAFTACGVVDVDMDQVGASQRPIIGGTPDTGDPSVVMVYGSNPSQPGYFICTGSVISPHVVLTAAHCVAPSEVGLDAQFYIYLGDDYNNRAQRAIPANFVDVQEVHANPHFKGMNLQQGNDVGVIITKTAMTLTPLPVNHAALTAGQRLQPVQLTGYGLLYGNDTGRTAGTKRRADTVLSDFDEAFLYFFDPVHNTCHGDSGGPQLMKLNGYTQIIGITSFDTVSSGGQPCSDHSTDTRADVYTSFIDPYVAQFDPTWTQPDLWFPPQPDMAMVQPDMSIVFTRTGGCDAGGARGQSAAGLALVAVALAAMATRRRRSSSR